MSQAQHSQSSIENGELGLWGVCGAFGIMLGGLLGLLFYFLPSLLGRHKKNIGAIFALNLLLGWTFVGWIIALVWGLSRD